VPRKEDDVIGRLDFAMEATIKADPIEARIRKATKEGKLPQRTLNERRLAALNLQIITQEELDHLAYTDRLRRDVIKVDDHEHDLARGHTEEPWQAKKTAVGSM
jgi:acyl-CoA dehydrogenase